MHQAKINMDVEIVETNAISPALLDAWQRLFNTSHDARFYHHPHWLQCVGNHLAPGMLKLGFVFVKDQLQMVLPIIKAGGSARCLSHPAHDHLSLNDILIHPTLQSDGYALLDAIAGTLSKLSHNWVEWQIANVPHNSALIASLALIENSIDSDNAAATNVNNQNGNLAHRWQLKPTRRSASFQVTGNECPPHGKLRRNLRRLRKQLTQRGAIRIEHVSSPDALKTAFNHFLMVEASGWKGTSSDATAIKATESLKLFYKALLTPYTPGVEPEINLLWCDDQCIAVQFGLRTEHCLSLLKIGYDEQFSQFSPGYLLLESVIENTKARGINTLSLVTSPPWADRWHPETVPVWHVKHYNNSTAGCALHHIDRLKQAAKSKLKKAA